MLFFILGKNFCIILCQSGLRCGRNTTEKALLSKGRNSIEVSGNKKLSYSHLYTIGRQSTKFLIALMKFVGAVGTKIIQIDGRMNKHMDNNTQMDLDQF